MKPLIILHNNKVLNGFDTPQEMNEFINENYGKTWCSNKETKLYIDIRHLIEHIDWFLCDATNEQLLEEIRGRLSSIEKSGIFKKVENEQSELE